MKRHYLYELDLKSGTAFCTVWGFTEIYIANTRTQTTPKVYCIKRARELRLSTQVTQHRFSHELRSQPDWKPRHFLSEIDPETLTAVCAICGPTDLRKVNFSGHTTFYCATKQRNYMRRYRRARYVARPTNPHALSEIDEEKQTAICAKCGPVKIDIWLGKKKVNRRCVNAKADVNQVPEMLKDSLSKIEV